MRRCELQGNCVELLDLVDVIAFEAAGAAQSISSLDFMRT
jgi:hypothetical protein